MPMRVWVSFRIHENGSITKLNTANIKGMRGCQLSVDPDGKYLFVAGYHDGKATVMNLNPDGTVGSIAAGVYHKGLGSVAERMFRPPCQLCPYDTGQKVCDGGRSWC